MRISNIIWLPRIIDKLDQKHHVIAEEVEEVFFFNKPIYRKIKKGRIPGENLYAMLGRSNAGRYLIVFFIYKSTREALIISAREMDNSERRLYERR